jgi:undecaprenyl-diphosphatase
MTTFQAVIYALTSGMSHFLPISVQAHEVLIAYLTGWPSPTGAFLGILSLGAFLSAFVYFRHDWASMISSGLQVILFRRRPMMMDERLPFFIIATLIPPSIARYYFSLHPLELSSSLIWVGSIFAASGLALLLFDFLGRKTKGMYDWKWSDAIILGLVQCTFVLPGWDPLSALLVASLFLNYKREPAAKYAYFCLTPIYLYDAVSQLGSLDFHQSSAMPELSWLSFGAGFLVSFFVGLLAIGGFMKHVQTRGLGQYVFYRWILSIGVMATYWIRR